jgi:glyoxylase-like metal-dependent hydrolase (beta-lactamase superfamily II)
MGDTYFNQVTLPFIDLNSGGNAKGILASAEKALSLADDDTQIIPGHGPMAGKADLQAYRDMMASVISRVQAGIDAGQTLEELQAQDLLKDIDVNKDGFIKQDAFIGFVYESLKTA